MLLLYDRRIPLEQDTSRKEIRVYEFDCGLQMRFRCKSTRKYLGKLFFSDTVRLKWQGLVLRQTSVRIVGVLKFFVVLVANYVVGIAQSV
jgi:hypothetical protein